MNKTHTGEQNRESAHAPEAQASAYGTQMAKYFTMNQPPSVAIDSAVSVVRPQLAITRLIARSGIPERTASIPSEKAYVVSGSSSESCEFQGMGTLDRWQVHKNGGRGQWALELAMCGLGVKFEYSKPEPHRLDPLPCSACNPWIPSRTMPECLELGVSTVFMEVPDPILSSPGRS